jgi:cytochrome c2
VRIFASHDYWHREQQCFVERVSVLVADNAALAAGAPLGEWKTLYETTPCLPVHGERRRHGIPFVGYFGGGRMQLLDAQTLLLAVGDFGFDGVASIDAVSQDVASSYGKIFSIHIADGTASLFSIGHRNPQGLFVDDDGKIWEAEHGPLGGDKINLLVKGANYGWPYATFGTDYGSFSWPLNKPESEWGAYQDPVFAFVPSMAVSNLFVVHGDLFPRWRGDLLIGTLKDKTLLRAHVRGGHVLYLESMYFGARIRDLIEGRDGRVLVWSDDSDLTVIRPGSADTGEAMFAEKCSGCHQLSDRSGDRMGPNLAGVVGRPVASLSDYPDYSPALRRLGGSWSEERLSAFLKQPTAVCPGTHMDFAGLADPDQRAAVIAYLKRLE